MQRHRLRNLHEWYQRPDRKPLVLRGARQVGKTWLVRNFAKKQSVDLIEINFEDQPKLAELFITNDPAEIIRAIEQLYARSITPQNTLLFLDEIQVVPELLAKLRWFYEKMPELPVITAGSLLEFVLDDHEFSMPVGRIEYMHLEPFNFSEFLLATGNSKLVEMLETFEITDNLLTVTHERLLKLFNEFVFIGGMPAAISTWCKNQSLLEVSRIHHNLMNTYRDDFNKYAGRINRNSLEAIVNSVPKLLGRKFIYSHVSKEFNSTTLGKALQLLCKARVCHKILHTSANGLPLKSESNSKYFKVAFIDCGLVAASLGLPLAANIDIDTFNLINRGSMAEQVVGQLLRTIEQEFIEPELFYWQRETPGSNAEIDYLLANAGCIVPLEVKAGTTGSLRSLHSFMQRKQYSLACRINADMPSLTPIDVKMADGSSVMYQLLSLPFYLIEQCQRLLLGTR